MEERYTKLFTLPEKLYSCGSPVVVSAGALLKDNKKGDVLVQLKIGNIHRHTIKALTVKIISFDIAGRQLGEETIFQYLDLNAKRDEEFGQKIPIILPDNHTRAFSVCVTETVFDDQTIWVAEDNQWEPMAKRIPLDKMIPDNKLKGQFQIKYGSRCIDLYQEYQDLWYCSCGAVNRKEEATCHSCGLRAITLAEVDLNKLKVELRERLAKEDELRAEQEAREKKKREEEELQRAVERAGKKKSRIILAISSLLFIMVAVLIFNYIRIEQEEAALLAEYNEALALLNEGKYTDAIEIFMELGNYQDSVEQIELAKAEQEEAALLSEYNKAVTLLDEEKYTEAIAIFAELGNYRNSAEQLEQAREACRQKQIAVYNAGRSISARIHTVVVCSDGTVEAVGYDEYGQCEVSDWNDIVAVAVGDVHTVGLHSDGTVVAVGANSVGQCEVSDWSDIVAVAAGSYHTVGLRSDGTVVAVGSNQYGRCNVSDWSDIVAVAAGEYHTVGLRSDGTVVAVGSNESGQCNVSDWSDIVAVAAGNNNTIGLHFDRTVEAVGFNGRKQCEVSGWSDIVAVAAGDFHTVGLRSDGTVVAVGYNEYGQCDVIGWSDIVAVAAGNNHTVGLHSDGTVVAMGYNMYGECEVTDWTNIKQIDRY